MLYPREYFELLREDEHPPAGSYVALGCPHPDCNWVSLQSRILDGEMANEIFLAFRAVEDQWERHWAAKHQPAPIRLLNRRVTDESETE
jgi:hypothetical protein